MKDLTPAEIASTDQALAEFDSLGIKIMPQAPVIALLAIDIHGVVHATRRPNVSSAELVEATRACCDFIESLGDA